ncbi:hypothetical protein XENOCAPTIV_004659 [Xenoophorus captivus]|uniref:Uncharacterized protein n=1 Tax=Xenoophorus captivus TaxID=1517983 RepID=A0ABV0RNV1_9TELE
MFLVQPFQSNNLKAEYILGRLPVHHRNTQECSWPPALMAPFPLSQLWACGKRLKNSSNPPTKRDRGYPAFTPAPTAASPGPASAVVLLRSRLSNRSSRSPGSNVFFYSGHPTIFPASFISSLNSFQSFISSFTQLLQEFTSNSATSEYPLLRSANVQPAAWPLPLTFTIATLVLARL